MRHEVEHRFLELVFRHLAVADHHPRVGHEALQQVRHRIDRLDAVVDEEHLPAAGDLGANRAHQHRRVELHDVGLNREPVFRRRLDHRHVADADQRHVQRARNRRRRHRQHVDLLAHLLDALLVRHAEALLFVDDQQAEILEVHVLRQQPMRADDDVETAGGKGLERFRDLLLGAEAADHVDLGGERRKPLGQRLQMLRRQDGRRREEGDLFAFHHRLERRAHRHLGLAVADVAAQQSIHRRRRFHVALDVGDRGCLIRRERKLERVLEFLLPMRIGAERIAGDGLARRIELEQLLGHVAHGLLDLGLGAFPGRAAEPIERRLRAAGVLLDQVEPFDRHEQLRIAVILQLEEFLDDVAAGDRDLLEADELADAVIDVDDQIADLEVAQVGKECGGRRALLAGAGLAPFLVEDVGFGVNVEGLGPGT